MRTIPFEMHWRACCLTLDRVTRLQYPLSTAHSYTEPFFYVHSLKQEDTYATMVKTIPLNMRSSKCFKGIVIICNEPNVGQLFSTTQYTSDETLLPLYVVQVEHVQLLWQTLQAQQPPTVKAVESQSEGVQLDNSEALHIRFIPKSGGKLSYKNQH